MKTEDGKYFNSLEYAEIKAGESYADVVVQAEEAGAESSGILSGAIKILVDPIPYISGVSNTTPSTGGLDHRGRRQPDQAHLPCAERL